jgi:Tol biopolymer transport system component/imidazolonepropionase-like amidohydrolase
LIDVTQVRTLHMEEVIPPSGPTMRKPLALAACTICLALTPAAAPVHLTLHEGTNIAAALSPDGRNIAFDLLGAIWTMPATGGTARRITDELMDARQPAWSSDSRSIAFQAYRTNTWNIWSVAADGTGLKQLTWGPFDDREPDWSPDRTRIVFSSDRSGNYDVWVLTLATGGLRRITGNPANDFAPAWSPDGRYVAFVSDREGARGIYTVVPAVAAESTERLVRAASGALAGPSWSPDGLTIAFNAIAGAKSALMVGANDIAEPNEDVFPFRPQWISATELLYTADGKIKRRPAAGGAATTVEFSADISFERPAFSPKHRDFAKPGPQPVRGIMHPAISPDGKQVAFSALGDLWLMPVGGTPRRLTNDPFIEIGAAWSPDGRWLAYSSDRAGSMDLWLRDVATGAERRVTASAGAKTDAAWSPDGNRIAMLRAGSTIEVVNVSRFTGVDLPRDTTPPSPEASLRGGFEPGAPSWSPDGRFIVMSALKPNSARFREGSNEVLRLTVADGAERWFDPLAQKSIGMRKDYGPVWSPDGTQMAAIVDGRLAAFPVSREGEPVGPVRMLSTELANSPSWAGDSRHLFYQSDDRFKLVDVVDGSVREIDPHLTWTVASTSSARGTAAAPRVIHAGRLWDGTSGALRENVDIVVEGNRIRSVEPHRAALHTGTVVDASGETVIPGLIDIHSHLTKAYGESLGRIWLSWGITTVRNPATNPFEAAEEKESVESGRRIGPRTFSAGDPIDGTRIYYPGGTTIDGGAQLSLQLARAERLGYDLMKTYVRLPDLLQKRVVEEAHKRGLPVTSHELYPAVAYGADGVEHIRGTSRRGYSPKVSLLNRTYADVIELLAASGMTITPTTGIQGGFQLQTIRDSSWLADPRMALYPPAVLQAPRALAKAPHPQADLDQRAAMVAPVEKTVSRIVRAGGRVTAGTDAPINPYGLSLLMELEQYVSGGLTPLEALRSATSANAQALGMGADLGAIAPGRFADLVMLDGNPLANIRDLRKVRRVMKDGELYLAEALVRGPARAGAARR